MLKHAARMGSDPLRRHGIGRFAGSAAQDPMLMPEASLLVKHRLKCSELPDRYAQSAALSADVRESLRVMADIRRIARSHSISELATMEWSGMPDEEESGDEVDL